MRLTIKQKLLAMTSILILKRPTKLKQLFLQEIPFRNLDNIDVQQFNQI